VTGTLLWNLKKLQKDMKKSDDDSDDDERGQFVGSASERESATFIASLATVPRAVRSGAWPEKCAIDVNCLSD
jgi:hypothetical protein